MLFMPIIYHYWFGILNFIQSSKIPRDGNDIWTVNADKEIPGKEEIEKLNEKHIY